MIKARGLNQLHVEAMQNKPCHLFMEASPEIGYNVV